MNIKNKKILVTGGAGFIGSHTVDALIKKGARVVVVDNVSSGKRENVNPKAKFYKVNISSPKFAEILNKEKPKIIYHFSFFVFVPESVKNPLLDMDSIIGSLRILEYAKNNKIEKIIFASSGFLYGNTKNLPAKETEPVVPASPYAIAKFTVENYLQFHKAAFNIPYVVLRYSAVYGPRQVTGAMADYIRKLSIGKQADIWGDGTKTRDYVFIEDAVKANVAALDVADNYKNPVFNIGTGVETTLNTLYKEIAKLLGKKPSPIYKKDRPGEQIKYCLDNTKAKKELGWKPEYTLEDGLRVVLSYKKLI